MSDKDEAVAAAAKDIVLAIGRVRDDRGMTTNDVLAALAVALVSMPDKEQEVFWSHFGALCAALGWVSPQQRIEGRPH